ncbi:hypothetical protein BD779DRAFT_1430539, partial [Infundibulicybe gibba]
EAHYKLKGIIYYGNNHFTARVISPLDRVWFHDGMETGPAMEYEGTLSPSLNLTSRNSRPAVVAIYT